MERAPDDIIGHLQFPEEGFFLIGKEFVEDKAEHVVLVLAGLDARTSHLVRRVPQFLRKLLLFMTSLPSRKMCQYNYTGRFSNVHLY